MTTRMRQKLHKKIQTYSAPITALGHLGEITKDYVGDNYRMASKTKTKKQKKGKRKGKIYRKRIPRTLQPYSIIRKLKTSFYYSFDPGAGALSYVIPKLNDAYDLMGSSGTQQGLGYDQYALLYNRYCVVGWKVDVKMVTSENTHPIMFGFTPMTSSTALSTYDHYAEIPGTVQRLLTPDTDKAFLHAKGSVKKYMMPKGGKLLTDDSLCAGIDASPTRTLHGHFYAQAMDQTADPGATKCLITVTQLVVFYVPKVPSRSTTAT